MQFVTKFWKSIFDVKGRSQRAELLAGWLSVIAIAFVVVLVGGIIGAIVDSSSFSALLSLLLYVVLIPGYIAMFTCEIRRFHDIGKPWYWIFISLIPCVGSFILLYFLFFVDSDPNPNQWGVSPKFDNGNDFSNGYGGYDQSQNYNQGSYNQGFEQNNFNQQNYSQPMQNQGYDANQGYNQQQFGQSQGYDQNQNFGQQPNGGNFVGLGQNNPYGQNNNGPYNYQ